MIEIDNKVYRNIPEQVGKNKDDIELLKKAYGYHGPFASKDDIVSPVDQALYLIGTTYPYEIYQYKELTDTYLDLGPFAAAGAQGPAGPQGPQGPQGIPGEDGKSVDAYTKEETDTLINNRFGRFELITNEDNYKSRITLNGDDDVFNDYGEFVNNGYTFGNLDHNIELVGESERPYYRNDSTVESVKEIALLKDVNTKANASDVYTKTESNALLDNKADKSTTYTKNTVDALFNKRFWNWKFENNSSTNQGGLYHGEDTIISNNYDNFSGYTIGDWNTDYLLTGMSDRPKYSNSDEIKEVALLEDVNTKANKTDVYTKTETDALLNGVHDVKEFTIEKGSIGDEIGTEEFFNYLITTGFNAGQYLNKICRFSYVDSEDYKYEYLVIPTYYDASDPIYSNLTIISDGGVYTAYISGEEHEISTYIGIETIYAYCGKLNNLQTKTKNNLVDAINEVNTKTKANTDSLYSYVLDTTSIDIDRNIPSTVDIGGVTFDIVDKVKASFNRLGGQTVFDSNHLLKTDCPAVISITKRNFSSKLILQNELAAIDSLLLASYSQYGQYLRGYSVNDSVYNYIDFAKKKFIINCAERSYQAGDEADLNVFTDLTRSIYKLETPIEVDISSILKDDSGITPPLELGGQIYGIGSNRRGVYSVINIEMIYKMLKESV